MIKKAVTGVGNMGSKYASFIQDGMIQGMELSSITRVRSTYREMLLPSIESGMPAYETADKLFTAVENKELAIDAVVIATPHYAHEEEAVRAFKNGLHVLCDKPSGVGGTDCLRERKTENRRTCSGAGRQGGRLSQKLQGLFQKNKSNMDRNNSGKGRKSLLLSNAAYLSSWEKRMVDIPNIGTDEELEFERLFEKWLEQKRSR